MILSIKYYFQLLKFRLSLTVVISATAGYLIGVENFDFIELILLAIGGFLVTGSANGFNQILEKDYDKLMLRTMHRPLPQKKISTLNALIFSFIIGVLGLYLLSMIKPHGSFYGFLSKSSDLKQEYCQSLDRGILPKHPYKKYDCLEDKYRMN